MNHWPCCGKEVSSKDVTRIEKLLARKDHAVVYHRGEDGCGKQLFASAFRTSGGKIIPRLTVVKPGWKPIDKIWPCCGRRIKETEAKEFAGVPANEQSLLKAHGCGSKYVIFGTKPPIIKIIDAIW